MALESHCRDDDAFQDAPQLMPEWRAKLAYAAIWLDNISPGLTGPDIHTRSSFGAIGVRDILHRRHPLDGPTTAQDLREIDEIRNRVVRDPLFLPDVMGPRRRGRSPPLAPEAQTPRSRKNRGGDGGEDIAEIDDRAKWLTIKEVGKMVRKSTRTIERDVERGIFPPPMERPKGRRGTRHWFKGDILDYILAGGVYRGPNNRPAVDD
jgi:hypothetical protein